MGGRGWLLQGLRVAAGSFQLPCLWTVLSGFASPEGSVPTPPRGAPLPSWGSLTSICLALYFWGPLATTSLPLPQATAWAHGWQAVRACSQPYEAPGRPAVGPPEACPLCSMLGASPRLSRKARCSPSGGLQLRGSGSPTLGKPRWRGSQGPGLSQQAAPFLSGWKGAPAASALEGQSAGRGPPSGVGGGGV